MILLDVGKKMKCRIMTLLMGCLFACFAHAESPALPANEPTSTPEVKSPAQTPDLSEIIPLSAELFSQSKNLENSISGLLNFTAVDKQLTEIQLRLKTPIEQLERLKESEDYKYAKLIEIKDAIRDENDFFQKINKPLNEAVSKLGRWRKHWLTEKQNWQLWQTDLLEQQQIPQLQATFDKVNETIDSALNLIQPQLQDTLKVQTKAAQVQVAINGLNADLEILTSGERYNVLYDVSPPMFTKKYYSQFEGNLWSSMKKGVSNVSWPDGRFFSQQGWIIMIQVLIALAMIVAFYRNRAFLQNSKRWFFLTARPFSAALFIVFMLTTVIYAYEGAPLTWKIVIMLIAGISYIRLSAPLINKPWKRHFIFGLTVIMILTNFLELISFPDPLFRLYILLVALAGFLFCRRSLSKGSEYIKLPLYRGVFRLLNVFFVVIMVTMIWGKTSLAMYLFSSLFDSSAVVLVFMLFLYMVQGGVEWLFRSSFLKRAAVLYSNDTDLIIKRVTRFVDLAAWGLLLLPSILVIWDVYDNLGQATKELLLLGFNLGTQRITVGLTIIAIGVVYASFLISWLMQKIFMDVVYRKSQVERGVRLSIERLIHYLILFVGFLVAISMLGFEVTKITIVLSALGVGIGFGLQGVVNNFVSGLILLFERPVRVGDTIQLGEKWAEIRRIGLRSTTIKTFDEADVIVPNSDLISNQVTNWTLSNRLVRLSIPVGVAYGSDVPLVMDTLADCAKDNEMIADYPPSQVLFVNFGDSSLNFELRVWVKDADYRLIVRSKLLQDIDHRFRQKNIEISFPQRDLHLRSLDPSVVAQTLPINKKQQ